MRLLMMLVLLFLFGFAHAAPDFETSMRSAHDRKLGLNARWNALVQAASVATAAQLPQIKKFASHADWYMRNATLVALKQVNLNEAAAAARSLLTDKALVVRSAAVDVLTEALTEKDRELLITELNKPYNFNKKSSLWIRRQIVEKLANEARVSERAFFARNLFDSDREVAEISAKTLAKMSGENFESLKSWQNRAKEKNWL